MEAEQLTSVQKQRILFAGKLMGYMHQMRGEAACTSYFVAEDGFTHSFHACFCTPGQITIIRYSDPPERGEEDGS